MPPVQDSELSSGGSFVWQPSPESIRECKILTNSNSAEYAMNGAVRRTNLDGPVRDRAFFVSYEALHERREFTRLAVTPSAAERAGDLSGRPQPVLDPFTRQPFPVNRVPAVGFIRLLRARWNSTTGPSCRNCATARTTWWRGMTTTSARAMR